METVWKLPEMIGRGEELSLLRDRLEDAVKGKGGAVFVAGEAGLGKTRLVSELLDEAEKKEMTVIKGWCLAESTEPLMPFREAFRDSDMYHLMAGEPPPRVISAYIMGTDGVLVAKAQREATDLDGDIFASMLTAVGNFVTDSLAMMGKQEKGLNAIRYGSYTILIESGVSSSLACVIEGAQSEFLIDDMRSTLMGLGDRLDHWDGRLSEVEDIQEKISWFVTSGKYDGKFLVDDPKLKQENLFDSILLGMQRSALERPLILFIDDLQWADHTTLTLLHYLARNTRKDRVFILGTYRPEDILKTSDGSTHKLKTTMQNMSRENLLERVELKRLSSEDTVRIILSSFGNIVLDKDLTERIHRETEGNPFFVLEVIKLLVEEGGITGNDDSGWNLSADIDDMDVPSRVYDVIKRRLDRLMTDQREILECASIEGEEFRSEVIGRVLEINRLKLLKNLSGIEKTHRLIHSLPKKYRFDHTKIREVLYKGMIYDLRREYHRIVGDTILGLYKDDTEPPVNELAHHYYEAGDDRAGYYLVKAGDYAKERFANTEAVRLYQLALGILEKTHDKAKVSESLGEVCGMMGEYGRAIELFNDAFRLSEDIEVNVRNLRKMAEAHQKRGEFARSLEVIGNAKTLIEEISSPEKGRILVIEGNTHYRKGDSDKAMPIFSEAVKLFQQFGGDRDLGNAIRAMGNIHLNRGEFEEALEHYEKSLTVMEKTGDNVGIASALNNMGIVYQDIGESERALDFYQRSLEIEEKIGNKWGIAQSLNNIGIVYRNKNQPAKALEYYKSSLKIKEKIGDRQGIADTRNNIGQIHRSKGEMDEALRFYEESRNIYEDIGDKKGVSTSLNNMGKVLLSIGDLEGALDFYRDCLKMREEVENPWGIAQTLNNIGEALLYSGKPEDALEYYGQGLSICSDIGDTSLTIQTLCGLSEVHLELGVVRKAYEYAERALETGGEEGIEHRVLGMVYREMDEWVKAKREFERAKTILEDIGDKDELAKLYYEYALLLKKTGDSKQAGSYLKDALELFREIGFSFWAKRCESW